ncbi:hypothetical protein ACFL6O_01120 [candidate division KSB1 bacterium]
MGIVLRGNPAYFFTKTIFNINNLSRALILCFSLIGIWSERTIYAQGKIGLSLEIDLGYVNINSESFVDPKPVDHIASGYFSDIRSRYNLSGKLLLNLPYSLNPYLSYNYISLYENDLFNIDSGLLRKLYSQTIFESIETIQISAEDIYMSGFGAGIRIDPFAIYKIRPFIQAEINFYNFSTRYFQEVDVSGLDLSDYPDEDAHLYGQGQFETDRIYAGKIGFGFKYRYKNFEIVPYINYQRSKFAASNRFNERRYIFFSDELLVSFNRFIPDVRTDQIIDMNWIEAGLGISYAVLNKEKTASNSRNELSNNFCIEASFGISNPSMNSFDNYITDRFFSEEFLQHITSGRNREFKLLFQNKLGIYPYLRFEGKSFSDKQRISKLFWNKIFWNTYTSVIENLYKDNRQYTMSRISSGLQYYILTSDYVKPYLFGEISLCRFSVERDFDSGLYDNTFPEFSPEELGFKGDLEIKTRKTIGWGYGIGLTIGRGRLTIIPEFKMTFVKTPVKDMPVNYTVYHRTNGTVFAENDFKRNYSKSFKINTLEASIGIRYAIPNVFKYLVNNKY